MTDQKKFYQREIKHRDDRIEELKALLQKTQPEIEFLINFIQTGGYRNKLTDLNIELLTTLQE